MFTIFEMPFFMFSIAKSEISCYNKYAKLSEYQKTYYIVLQGGMYFFVVQAMNLIKMQIPQVLTR